MTPTPSEMLMLGAAPLLLGVVGFFLRGLAVDFKATAARVEQAVATLAQMGVRVDGAERDMGRLEGKLEALEHEVSELRTEVAVLRTKGEQ